MFVKGRAKSAFEKSYILRVGDGKEPPKKVLSEKEDRGGMSGASERETDGGVQTVDLEESDTKQGKEEERNEEEEEDAKKGVNLEEGGADAAGRSRASGEEGCDQEAGPRRGGMQGFPGRSL